MSSPTQQQPNSPDYLSTLGLDRAPFLDKIDDHFFYADPALVQRLDLLQHLTRFGDMLLGITGPLGSGKSTLLQQFLARGNTTWRSCHIDGGKITQADDLLSRLAEGFGQNMTATPERIRTDVIRYCESLQHNSQQAVVVIDDAQLLPEPALKALLSLGGEPRETLKLIRVLLFSEPGLEQKLLESGLHSPQQPLLHNLVVPCFDEQQTTAYLMYRLAAAGYAGDSPFSLTEIRAMHKAAEGLPGKLNTLAHETLIEHATRLAARKKAKPEPKQPAAATTTAPSPPTRSRKRAALTFIGLLLILGAVGSYFMQSGLLQVWQDRLAAGQTFALNSAPAPIPTESIESSMLATPALDNNEQTPVPAKETGQAKILETLTESIQQADIKEDKVIMADSMAPETALSSVESDPVSIASTDSPEAEAAATPPAEAAEIPASTAPDDSPAVSQPDEPKLAPAPAETTTETPPANTSADPPVEAAPIIQDSLEPEPIPAPAASPESPPAASVARESEPDARPAIASSVEAENARLMGATWLLARPAENFTLQLLGVRNESSLREFLAHSQLPGPIAYFHTEYKGGDWYVLVQGDYPTMTAARAAIAKLPASIRKAKPWPRTFSTVHADIDKVSP